MIHIVLMTDALFSNNYTLDSTLVDKDECSIRTASLHKQVVSSALFGSVFKIDAQAYSSMLDQRCTKIAQISQKQREEVLISKGHGRFSS